jgi:FG-GAP repeat/HYR domain
LTVTDVNSTSSQCQAVVTVLDQTSPTISCPTNVTINANGNCQNQIGAYSLLSKSDNCATLVSETQSPLSTTVLTGNNATQTVTLTGNDGNGNTANCSFTVTLKDVTPPIVSCPTNVTINANGNCQSAIGAYALLSKSDNCASLISESQSPSSSTVLTGHNAVQTVTLTGNDGNGNTANCSFSVTLKDQTPPTISCPTNVTINANGNCQNQIGAYSLLSKSDNCATIISESQSPISSTVLTGNNATQTVTLTGNDGNGNTANCSFLVTLKDVTPPVVSCPTNVTINANGNCQNQIGAYTLLSKTDNCATVISESQIPASSTVLTGNNATQTVTLTGNDGNGNTANCSFTVTLKDLTPPTISCPTNVTINANGNCQNQIGAYSLLSKTDNCATIISESQSPASSTVLTGNNATQTVTLTGNDGNGNTANCSFLVTLKDVTPPTISCPTNVTINANANCQNAIGAYSFLTKSDNCATLVSESQSPLSSTVLTGNNATQTVTLTGNDGNGNTANCSFWVTLKDVTPPTISCPTNVTINANGNCQNQIGAYSLLSKTDNCATLISESQSPASSTVLTGNNATQTVTLTGNDGNGNTANCSFLVTLKDVAPPSLICKPATVFLSNTGNASISVTNVYQSGSDNCGTVNLQSAIPNTFNCSNLGTNIVTLTANDGYGNIGTCTSVVTVIDNISPSIVCPESIQVTGTNSDCSTPVFYAVQNQDNCGVTNITYTKTSGSVFNSGTTLVKVKAFDVSGNFDECQFWVFVEKPAEICNDGIDNDCDSFTDEWQDFEQVAKEWDFASGDADQFGNAVDIDSSRAIVGVQLDDAQGTNAGAAQIYERNTEGQWLATKRLIATDGTSEDQFGHAVIIRKNWALISANLRENNGTNNGCVYVFGRNTGGTNNWGLVTKLSANTAGNNLNFGSSLDFDGRFAIVGCNLDDTQGSNAGASFIFDAQNAWAQVAKLTASDGMANDDFGSAVAIDNQQFALIGAKGNDSKGLNAGAGYLFQRNTITGTWTQIKKLTAMNTAAGDLFGTSVDLDGDNAVVGAPFNDFVAADAGAGSVFERNVGGTNNWGEISKLFAYDAASNNQYGRSIAVKGTLAVLGSPMENEKGTGAGAAVTFIRVPDGSWAYSEKIMDATGNANDNLFSVMALSDRTIITAAPHDDAHGLTDNGTAQWFSSLCESDESMRLDTPSDIVNKGSTPQKPIQINALAQNEFEIYPNPFTNDLHLKFGILEPLADASITLCNTFGQVLVKLHKGKLTKGMQDFQWHLGSEIPMGTYFLHLNAGEVQEVWRVVKMKE